MANIITCIRIVCSIALLFCPVFSSAFYALYIAAGVTDMIDGAVVCVVATAAAIHEGYLIKTETR